MLRRIVVWTGGSMLMLGVAAAFVGSISCGSPDDTFTYVGGPPLEAPHGANCTSGRAGYVAGPAAPALR